MEILYFISDKIESFLRNDIYYQQFQKNFTSKIVSKTNKEGLEKLSTIEDDEQEPSEKDSENSTKSIS